MRYFIKYYNIELEDNTKMDEANKWDQFLVRTIDDINLNFGEPNQFEKDYSKRNEGRSREDIEAYFAATIADLIKNRESLTLGHDPDYDSINASPKDIIRIGSIIKALMDGVVELKFNENRKYYREFREVILTEFWAEKICNDEISYFIETSDSMNPPYQKNDMIRFDLDDEYYEHHDDHDIKWDNYIVKDVVLIASVNGQYLWIISFEESYRKL